MRAKVISVLNRQVRQLSKSKRILVSAPEVIKK
jgi:hypothetical protein